MPWWLSLGAAQVRAVCFGEKEGLSKPSVIGQAQIGLYITTISFFCG